MGNRGANIGVGINGKLRGMNIGEGVWINGKLGGGAI